MTISNSGSDERGKITGGAAGDQTGGEWRVRSWYNGSWDVVLRHPDKDVREMIAKMAEAAAKNDKVGYDQAQRHTFWSQLSKSDYKPEKIATKCEADCSAGVAACVKGAGYRLGNSKLKSLDHTSYTGNLRSRLKAVGFTALTASKYLTSDKYLLRGDILLNDVGGGHTCINLTTGSKAETSATTSPSSTSTKTDDKGYTATVTATALNVRNGAGTNYAVSTSYKKGATCKVTDEKINGTTVWGKTSKGWISMTYASFKGKVTASALNIRKGAGTNYAVVGSYSKGATVTVTEMKANGSTIWGKTSKGWISMTYVDKI